MIFILFLDGGQSQELGTQTPVFEDKQFKRRIAILQKLQDKYQKLGPEEQEKVPIPTSQQGKYLNLTN
jgi:hypothetical protein